MAYLIFHVNRNFLKTKYTPSFIAPNQISLLGEHPPKTAHNLNLSYIIFHYRGSSGGHYWAYI